MNAATSPPIVRLPLAAGLRRAVTSLASSGLGQAGLALLDQSLVSGGRFATSVLVGRVCGQESLGHFTLGFTIVLTILCLQDSLISVPYNVYGSRLRPRGRRALAGSTLIHSIVLGAACSLLLAVAAAAVSTIEALASMAPVLGALSLAVPWLLLRELARRMAFAHLRTATALALDALVVVLQLAVLGWLLAAGGLGPGTAHLAAGAACLLSVLVWYAWVGRGELAWHRRRVVADLLHHGRLGRWLFASQMVFLLQWNAVTWLLALLAGATETGALAACLTLALLCNPLLLGMSNLLEPRVVLACVSGGPVQVWRMVVKWTVWLLLLVTGYCALIALFGSRGLSLLYGPAYAVYAPALTLMALTVLAGTWGLAADAGLRAVERADVGFRISVLSLVVTLGLAAALIPGSGVTGAAGGMLAGAVAGSAARWAALAQLVRTARHQPPKLRDD